MSDILLIDFSGCAHALWHLHGSDPDPTATSNAIVAKVRALAGDRRKGVGICLDSGRSFRNDISADYKANRSHENRAPLYHQIGLAIERLKADGFPLLKADGFEADDIIATACCERAFGDITIASADKDLLQLVNERVTAFSTATGAVLDAAAVREKFGIEPHQMADYLTLVGDSSDNVKGCPGIGAKGAAKLLNEFGNLDDLYAAIDAGATPSLTPNLRTKLQEFRTQLPITRSLIRLRTDAPIDLAPLFVERVPADVALFGGELSDEAAVAVASMLNRPDYEGSTMTMDEADEIIAEIMPGPAMVAKAETITLIPKSEQKPVEPKPEPKPDTALAVVDAEPVNAEYERQLEPRNLAQAKELARFMFESRLWGAYGTPQAVLSTVLAGREFGLPAMMSLRSFHIISGKPAMSADMMRALVQRSPQCEYFRCTERAATHATFATKRKGDPEVSLTFTVDEGRAAFSGDDRKWKESGWGKFPAAMCVARASTALCRLVYADVLGGGLYAPEELS